MSVIFAIVGAAFFAALIKVAPQGLDDLPGAQRALLLEHDSRTLSRRTERPGGEHIVGAICVVGAMHRLGRTTKA